MGSLLFLANAAFIFSLLSEACLLLRMMQVFTIVLHYIPAPGDLGSWMQQAKQAWWCIPTLTSQSLLALLTYALSLVLSGKLLLKIVRANCSHRVPVGASHKTCEDGCQGPVRQVSAGLCERHKMKMNWLLLSYPLTLVGPVTRPEEASANVACCALADSSPKDACTFDSTESTYIVTV